MIIHHHDGKLQKKTGTHIQNTAMLDQLFLI